MAPWRVGYTGVEEQGTCAQAPQEPGRSSPLLRRQVSLNEGNEVTRNGWLDVGVAHSTNEGGELDAPGTRWREGATGLLKRWSERWRDDSARQTSQRNCIV